MDATVFEPADTRPVRLSLQLIVKRHLPKDANSWDHEKIIDTLNKITHLRLDRENIGEIDNLELLGSKVTNVYLQENRISVLQNLDCLQNLQFLVLSGNTISKVENLRHFRRLLFLDLSNNCIDTLDVDELPQSLIILNLSGNPCRNKAGYKDAVLEHLPKLKQLDQEELEGENTDVKASDSAENVKELQSDDKQQRLHMSQNADGPQRPQELYRNRLPDIDASLQELTAEILLRSQSRLEEDLKQHLYRKMEMSKLTVRLQTEPK